MVSDQKDEARKVVTEANKNANEASEKAAAAKDKASKEELKAVAANPKTPTPPEEPLVPKK